MALDEKGEAQLELMARGAGALDGVFEGAPVGLGLVDLDFRYVRVNASLAEVNGYSAHEMVGRTPVELHGADGVMAQRLLGDVLRTGQPAVDTTVSPPLSCYPVKGGHGQILGVGVVAVDLPDSSSQHLSDATRELERELVRANVGLLLANSARNRLAQEAAADPLTGLANHRSFRQRLRIEVDRARRHGRALSLALADLDGFKDLNDAFGHPAGDGILGALAADLLATVRTADMVARLGGDEFAILMPETDAAAADSVITRARERIRSDPAARGVTISVGICDMEHASTADELLRFADGALYCAKADGRDAVWRYHPEVVEDLSVEQRAERMARSHALVGLRALARSVDAKDASTRLHSERVASLAARLAEELHWAPDRVAALREAALLHDVGKIGIADGILLKHGALNDEEYANIKTHASLGAQMASEVLSVEQTSWLRGHHERFDGSGYPDGLAGSDIPEGACLLALAECWDVMTSERGYLPAMHPSEALAEVRRCAGTQFSPDAVQILSAPGFERTLRIFANEQAARHGNEVRLAESRDTIFSLHCECGAENCPALIDVPAVEYRTIRSHDRRYIVRKGHELPSHEETLGTTDRYTVVEKR